MGKKFVVEQNGKVVTAEYNKERTYRLEFLTDSRAGYFVQGIHSAQEEIEKTGALQESTISLSFVPKTRTFTITFGTGQNAKTVTPKLDTEKETYGFYNDLRQEILKYRKITLAWFPRLKEIKKRPSWGGLF